MIRGGSKQESIRSCLNLLTFNKMKKAPFTKVGLLLLINVFISMTVNAQGIDSCSNVTVSLYELQYNDYVRYIENYEIYNDYSEPLWMWISRVPVKGLTVRQLRHDFMIKQFSDDPMSINMDLFSLNNS